MHHLKETTIDGVKFVLITEELHDALAKVISYLHNQGVYLTDPAFKLWEQYDPEVFDGL